MHRTHHFPSKLFVVLCSLVVATACEDVNVTAVDVASVAISPVEIDLYPEETHAFSAQPRSPSGNPLDDREVTWESEDPSIASVNQAGVVTGRAAGATRVMASSESVSGSATVTVRARPVIALQVEEVTFDAVAGEEGEHTSQVVVSNEAGGALSGLSTSVEYESNADPEWLTASLEAGDAPTSLLVSVKAEDLTEGSYRARIKVSSPLAENEAVLTVEAEVAPSPPRIGVSSPAVGFVWEDGQPEPPAQVITIRNTGQGELTGLGISLSHPGSQPGGWLSAELIGTTAPSSIRFEIAPTGLSTGLSTGVYDAIVSIASPVAVNSPQVVRVRLTVGDPPPELELDPDDGAHFQITEGTTSPPSRTIGVQNRGTGEVGGLTTSTSYDGTAAAGWLLASLEGPAAPTNLHLSLTNSALLPGDYMATVQLASPDAVNSPASVEVSLEVLPRPAAGTSELFVDPDQLTANGEGTAEVTVIVRDARGDRMPFGGSAVEVSITHGSLTSVVDHGDGRYTAVLTAPTTTGEGILTATVDGETIPTSRTVQFVAGAPSHTQSTLEASSETLVADGTSTTTLTATLRDPQGNIVTTGDSDVSFSLDGQGTLSPVEYDEAEGVYRSVLTSSTQTGTAIVSAQVDGQALESQVAVTYVAGPPAGATSLIEVDPEELVAGGSETALITVILRDAENNPIDEGGDLVELGATAGALATVVDEGDGRYTTVFTPPTTTGTVVITGSVNGAAIDDMASVEVVAGGVSADMSSVDREPEEITADGDDSAIVTVTLRDPNGNTIIEQRTVTLSLEGEGILSTTSPVFEPETHRYTAEVTSNTVGQGIVVAVAGGIELDARPTIVFAAGAPSPAHSTATVPNGTAGSETSIAISVQDAHGNPLPGLAAQLQVVVSGDNTASPAVSDLGGGNYGAAYTPESPGSDQVAITLDGTPISGSPFTSQVAEIGQESH